MKTPIRIAPKWEKKFECASENVDNIVVKHSVRSWKFAEQTYDNDTNKSTFFGFRWSKSWQTPMMLRKWTTNGTAHKANL